MACTSWERRRQTSFTKHPVCLLLPPTTSRHHTLLRRHRLEHHRLGHVRLARVSVFSTLSPRKRLSTTPAQRNTCHRPTPRFRSRTPTMISSMPYLDSCYQRTVTYPRCHLSTATTSSMTLNPRRPPRHVILMYSTYTPRLPTASTPRPSVTKYPHWKGWTWP